jgi:hypothetical protein
VQSIRETLVTAQEVNMTIDVGNVVTFTTTITDQNGAAIDPGQLFFDVRQGPSKRTYTYGTDPEIVRTGAGAYKIVLTLDTPGTLFYGWRTESPKSSRQSTVTIRAWAP